MDAETKGLVERLESHMGRQDVPVLLADCRQAAATITRLTAERDEARARAERAEARTERAEGALRAHQSHMQRVQESCRQYLIGQPNGLSKDAFVSTMLYLFDGPEQRAVQSLARAALAQEATDGQS